VVGSSRPFRFSVQTRVWADPDRTAEVARTVEQLGYDELYSFDHIGTIDPLLPLMVAATATTRLRVGPLVLNNELHHPVLLARAAATIDRLTDGRFVLGIGTGYAQSEHEAIGLALRPPAPRVDRFAECIEILRDLLDTGRCHRSGSHHVVALDELGVRPVQARLPILIGGFGQRVRGVAALHADIVQFTGLVDLADGNIDASGFAIDRVAERSTLLAELAGDRHAEIERSALVQVVRVGGGDASPAGVAAQLGVDESVLDGSPFVLIGSIEQVIDQIERIRERTGISHYTVREPEHFAPIVAALSGR
jgi:probable F420-dependent oxidoreductase